MNTQYLEKADFIQILNVLVASGKAPLLDLMSKLKHPNSLTQFKMFSGVESLHVPSTHIWLPDIVLYNK